MEQQIQKEREITLIQTKFNTIYEYYRVNGVKHVQKIDFDSYFYIKQEDFSKVMGIIRHVTNNLDALYYPGFTSIYKDKLIKIIPNKYDFWKIKRELKETNIQTFEYDIDVYLKYLLANKRTFSKTRRVGVIDIENDMSLDVVNTPKPITSITIYDYISDKYYTWVWSDKFVPNNRLKIDEVLYFFSNEKEMMLDFIEKFKAFDFDIVGGWNSDNFDWPYIINRIKNINLERNMIISWGEVAFRPFQIKGEDCFEIVIPGIELIDFIPVLKKNTCYSPQPASFSLGSCSKFYMNKDKSPGGPILWKSDINLFIAYNIMDVKLVKELIDKFSLIDFLMVIQSEIVPVPLRHTTHNSIVLLYYLKFLFPDKIITDNWNKIVINNENINLSNNYIKIKAAHVITANHGIYENVSIYDFAGLYPSIFRTFNISPDTLSLEDKDLSIDDIVIWKLNSKDEVMNEWSITKHFNQSDIGVYPFILKLLTTKRKEHKNKMKEFEKLYGEEDIRTKLELYRSDVLKQIANSLYGVGGFNKFCLFRPEISAAVTSMSRKLIMFAEDYINKQPGCKALYGDTDSVMIFHPKELQPKEFEKQLNIAIKDYVLKNFKINPENYCLDFEYANKTFLKFVMKPAKKKYYGILSDGKFYVKGFDIVQHTLSGKIKIILQELYTKLMDCEHPDIIRERIFELKKEFKSYDIRDLGITLKIAKDLNEYDSDIQHIRAAKYSNKYLGTNFKGGSVGKLYFISESTNTKYPYTDVLLLDETTKLPNELKIDYELIWKKLVLDKIRLLDEIEEMQVTRILNSNKSLSDFIK